MEKRKCKIMHNAVDINHDHLPFCLRDEYFVIMGQNEECTTVKHGLRKWVFENKHIKKV